MKILSGTSCLMLAAKVAGHLGISLGKCELSRFPNGENRVWVKENCADEKVAILQNFSEPVGSNIMQFCLMVDAVRRMKPAKIIGVIPWLGYAKQNRVFREGEPLSAEVVAKIVSSSGVDEVILLDIHNENVKSFFSVAVKELKAGELFAVYIKNLLAAVSSEMSRANGESMAWAVVSPDKGALARNAFIAEKFNLPLYMIDKSRDLENGKVVTRGIEAVAGGASMNDFGQRAIIMIDDMILSGSTVVQDAKFLRGYTSAPIYFLATHFCPTPATAENLIAAQIGKIIITNSIETEIPEKLIEKVAKIEISNLIAANLDMKSK